MAENTATVAETKERTWRDSVKDFILGKDLVGFVARLSALPILFYLGFFVWGLISAWLDPEGAAGYWSYFRNLLEMILALAAIIVFVALGILIVQIARFVNLLRSEVKPITDDTKLAIKNVRVTAEFVQKHAVKPILRFQAFLAGLIAFLSEIIKLSRLLQERDEEKNQAESEEN